MPAKKKPAKKPVAKAKAKARGMKRGMSKRPPLVPNKDGVILLSGGNPQIAKADGDAPVQTYIKALPGWKHGIMKRLDALIVKWVPVVNKAVKWNSPFYGIEGQGWFLGMHALNNAMRVTFFKGIFLTPMPPGGTPKSGETRWVDVPETWTDEAQLEMWVAQAASIPGWDPSSKD